MPRDRALRRCPWAEVNPLMRAYHDGEWGVPVHDDRLLFEYLVLDGFQAGLSWAVILGKREAFQEVFQGFDPTKVARFTPRRLERLAEDARIVRNRQKIHAAVTNAQALLEVRAAVGSFDTFIWGFVDGVPRQNRWRSLAQVPATTSESDAMSKVLKQRGFRFVGSTICYAFMQAVGLVNDHLLGCPRYEEVEKLGGKRAAGSGEEPPPPEPAHRKSNT